MHVGCLYTQTVKALSWYKTVMLILLCMYLYMYVVYFFGQFHDECACAIDKRFSCTVVQCKHLIL